MLAHKSSKAALNLDRGRKNSTQDLDIDAPIASGGQVALLSRGSLTNSIDIDYQIIRPGGQMALQNRPRLVIIAGKDQLHGNNKRTKQ
jgi:hypothetical protein